MDFLPHFAKDNSSSHQHIYTHLSSLFDRIQVTRDDGTLSAAALFQWLIVCLQGQIPSAL